MSFLIRSILVRGRPVLRTPFIRKPPCFTRRLGVPNILVLSRSASSATASFPCSHPNVAEQSETSNPQPDIKFGSPTTSLFFGSRETAYYHQCLENSPHHKDTIFTKHDLESLLIADPGNVDHLLKKDDWSHTPTSDIVEAFRSFTSYAHLNKLVISNPKFDSICCAISDRFKEFTDDEMIEIGKLHTLWFFPPSDKEKNYQLMRNSLDEFCCLRYTTEWYNSRNYTKILQAADIFYWQRWGAKCHFLRIMIYHLGIKTKEAHHLIQVMFYLGLLKNIPESYKMYDLEKRVFSVRENCSLTDLAIVVNSLFRSKEVIQYYPLSQDLLVKTLKNFSSLDDYLLTTISKGCNNAPRELKPLIALLQKRVTTNFHKFNARTIIHAMWTFVKAGVIEEDFAQLVYEKSIGTFSDLRTKEMTRIIIMFTELESPARDLKYLAEKVLAELQNSDNLKWFQKKDFIAGGVLHRLLICGVCPVELLNGYLESIDQTTATSRAETLAEKSKEALGIDVHLEMFWPNYTGVRLSPEVREAAYKYRFQSDSKYFVKSSGAKGKRSTFNLKWVKLIEPSVLEMLQGRGDKFLVKQLVPSFGYIDVVLRFSKEGTFLPIPEEMKTEPWKITRIPRHHIEEGDKFLALTFVSYSSDYISRNISCFQREKNNILVKLGYVHEEVPIANWINATPSQLHTNLQTIISGILSK